nr:MAG TPA: hypothetical protein [Caudoviricetes sp.]
MACIDIGVETNGYGKFPKLRADAFSNSTPHAVVIGILLNVFCDAHIRVPSGNFQYLPSEFSPYPVKLLFS